MINPDEMKAERLFLAEREALEWDSCFDLENKLLHRAKQSLQNPDEVDSRCVRVAINEALSVCGDRAVAECFILDYAMFRLKVFLKCELVEADYELLRLAQKGIETASFKHKSSEALVQTRRDIWS